MSKLTDLSTNIDSRVSRLAKQILNYAGKDSELEGLLGLLSLGVDGYRAEVEKEIDGLKSDVISAEAAYEREKVRADNLADENDRWNNESLLGWRKRVTEAERQRDHWKNDHDRIAKEKHQVAKDLESMTLAKDEWRADSCATEAKLEKALEERDGYKLQRDGAEIALGKIAKLAAHPDEAVDAASTVMPGSILSADRAVFGCDMAAPGSKDKSLIAWKCVCGTAHTFEPPRGAYWSCSLECSTCAAKVHLQPMSE